MFIDASAIIALLNREPRAREVATALQAHRRRNGRFFIAPTVVFESALGLAKARTPKNGKPSPAHIRTALAAVEKFIETLKIEEISIGPDLARKAVDAAARYGKVVGHRADLNFGDCFAYAAAKSCRARMLFTGNDFSHTDLNSVLHRSK